MSDIEHLEEVEELRAEIERLKAENEDLRRWKAMDKPLTAAMGVVAADLQQLRAEIERLRAEVAEWKERYEGERRDHETTIAHCDKIMNEGP